MKICPQCGKRYPPEVDVCQQDGSRLSALTDDPYVGYQLANFQFTKRIGRGGFGVVYLARHVELGNLVAVKILKKQFSTDQQLVERFRREARVSSQIAHENVVQIVDFGYDNELGFYYIMEYLDGKSLTDLMREYPRGMPIERLLPIMRQICGALEQAHAISVVHRDLKPSNIFLIKRFAQDDVVKILDFGIAKVLQGEEGSNMTVTGQIVGSPRFMSPEQARGRHSQVDPRSDIYSLGVILFWTLTGRLPFESKQLARLLYMHVKMPPPSLASVAPQHSFPPALEGVVQAALSKHKDDRPSTAQELYRRLEQACQAGEALSDMYADMLSPDAEDMTVRHSLPATPAPVAHFAPEGSHASGILGYPPPVSQDFHPTPEDSLDNTTVDGGHGDVNAELEAMLAAEEYIQPVEETVNLPSGRQNALVGEDLLTAPGLHDPATSMSSFSASHSSPSMGHSSPSMGHSSPSMSHSMSSPSMSHSSPSMSHSSPSMGHSMSPSMSTHPEPAAPKKTPWKMILLVLLGMILLFELAIVGWRLWQKRKRGQSFDTRPSISQPHVPKTLVSLEWIEEDDARDT